MFKLRHKRANRDRQSGLVFQWRLPVSSHLGFFAAIGVVGLIGVGLATVVRVRVGGPPRLPERRGSLILVPQGKDWRALEMLALEAGPMPRRDDPSDDPVVRDLVARNMDAAAPPGYTYQPQLRAVLIEVPAVNAPVRAGGVPGVLPPLPRPRDPTQGPPPPDPSRPLVLASGGIHATAPSALAPAGLARGNRYLLGYDAAGRVNRVITLFAAEPSADDSAESWLRQVAIEGGAETGGWTAVEIAGGS